MVEGVTGVGIDDTVANPLAGDVTPAFHAENPWVDNNDIASSAVEPPAKAIFVSGFNVTIRV